MIVSVMFDSSTKLYDFKYDIELSKYDKVLCYTANGPAVATVISFKKRSTKATRWIMQRIDVDAHRKRVGING